MIVLIHCYPPIPVRDFDWCCYDDEDPEDSPYGYGKARWEAEVNYYKEYMEQNDLGRSMK